MFCIHPIRPFGFRLGGGADRSTPLPLRSCSMTFMPLTLMLFIIISVAADSPNSMHSDFGDVHNLNTLPPTSNQDSRSNEYAGFLPRRPIMYKDP